MNILFSLIMSLLLTTLVSFAVPLVSISVLFAVLAIASHFPLIATIASQCYEQIWTFFMTFGEGSGTKGILTISIVAGFAGLLFEALNFYRFQILCHHQNSARWLTQPKSVEVLENSIKGQ